MFGDSDDNISLKENAERQKKECPYCDKLLYNLPRHLRDVHYLDPSDAKRISYCKRKRKISSSGKKRHCPLPECKFSQPFVRLDNHLKTKHSLNSTNELYRSICKVKSKTDSLKNEIKNQIKYSPFSLKESEIFVAFLQRLDGGKKGQNNARSQGFKLRQIINGVEATSVTDYCMPQTREKFQKFIEHYGKDHNPNSTVTYLSVLLSYLQFIIMRNFNADESKVPSVNLTLVPSRDVCKLEGVNIQIIKNLIMRVRNWRKAYRKDVSASTDFIDIPAEQFKEFEKSVVVCEAIKLLLSVQENAEEIQSKNHSYIRNVLLFLILLRNSSRSCSIYNMTLTEFNRATEHLSEFRIVKVKNHKTKAEHGPAEVVLTKEIYFLLSCYITKFRAFILKGKSVEHVFITWKGKQLDSVDFYNGLNSVWRKAGFKSTIGSSMLRHITTTRTHEFSKEHVNPIADFMCHRPSTATSVYRRKCKGDENAKNSAFVYQQNTSNDQDQITNFFNNSLTVYDQVQNSCVKRDVIEEMTTNDSEINCDIIDHGKNTSNQGRLRIEVNPLNEINSNINKIYYTEENKRRGRITFSVKERELIKEVFAEYLDCDVVPKLSTIRDIVNNNEILKELSISKGYKDTQFSGCLKNIRNRKIKGTL